MTMISKAFVRFFLATAVVIVLCLATVMFFLKKGCSNESSQNSQDFPSEVKSVELRPKTPRQAKTLRKGNRSSIDDILKLKRYEMERYGAIGSAVLRVKDMGGNPVPDAEVHLYFTQPKENDPSGTVKGKTDSQGMFAATRKTNFACGWKVSKEGYHSSKGRILFSPHFSEYSATTGEWTEEPLEATVILKPKSNAKILRGKRIFHDLKFPTNTWVGFDFLKCDCVAPYGQGQTAHIEFRSDSCGHTAIGDYGITNTLTIRTLDGGVAIFEEESESFSPFMPMAPAEFNEASLFFTYARTRNAILKNETLDKNKYIVFKTMVHEMSGDVFHFGILRQLAFWPGYLQFEYFFNTEPGDRRIDGDVKHGWDLGR